MVKQPQGLDQTFGALADPTRREILISLGEGDRTVSELAEPFDVSLPAISKHLGVLEDAGLVVRKRDGRTRRCRLVAEPMQEALGWIAQYGRFWEAQFDSLEGFLSKPKGKARRR
jgi:DNA-binding transcriptional ArsR family regulator